MSSSDPWPVRVLTPDLPTARAMLGSIARFNGFAVTITLTGAAGTRSFTGTPLEVLTELDGLPDDTQVAGLSSVLGPNP